VKGVSHSVSSGQIRRDGRSGKEKVMIFPPSKLRSRDRASYPKSWDPASLPGIVLRGFSQWEQETMEEKGFDDLIDKQQEAGINLFGKMQKARDRWLMGDCVGVGLDGQKERQRASGQKHSIKANQEES
jgi:hypothetical protein